MSSARVLQVVASSRGGGAVHVRDLALGLPADRYAVSVALPEDGGTVSADDFRAAGLPFLPLPIAGGVSRTALVALRRHMAQADLVHLHGARAALFGRLAALSLGAQRPRVVYTVHGFAAPYYPPVRRTVQIGLERMLAPLADCTIAVCQAERVALAASGVARSAQIEVVWNGIDGAPFAAAPTDRNAWRQQVGIPAEAHLITTVCRLYKPRDFTTLLHAFARTQRHAPSAHLLIVGDGPDRPEVAATVDALGIAASTTLAGWRTDLPAVYAASDIFVLTTWGWEGLPLTVLEAMAAGVPVVATRAGGIPEAVVAESTGILVERRSVASLEDALVRLLAAPELRVRFGKAGRQRVRQQFSLAAMIHKIDTLYARLLAPLCDRPATDPS
jgi:glycosyltransferase involved in cell wall biosynthesis